MPVISTRHTRFRQASPGPGAQTEIAGHIEVSGNVGAYPAGSFGLRKLVSLVMSSVNYGDKRSVQGSIREALGSAPSNDVRLSAYITGTTGSRTTSISSIGSRAGAGTIGRAYFVAFGN